jgi:hypothetical protein
LPLALYFPESSLTQARCREAGEQLRRSFFSGTGILLSHEARKRYFRLLTALRGAATAKALDVPTLDDYLHWVSADQVEQYRNVLDLGDPDDGLVRNWNFGETTERSRPVLYDLLRDKESPHREALGRHQRLTSLPPEERQTAAAALLFRDYILLQLLTSRLRTALGDDLRGRRRPA